MGVLTQDNIRSSCITGLLLPHSFTAHRKQHRSRSSTHQGSPGHHGSLTWSACSWSCRATSPERLAAAAVAGRPDAPPCRLAAGMLLLGPPLAAAAAAAAEAGELCHRLLCCCPLLVLPAADVPTSSWVSPTSCLFKKANTPGVPASSSCCCWSLACSLAARAAAAALRSRLRCPPRDVRGLLLPSPPSTAVLCRRLSPLCRCFCRCCLLAPRPRRGGSATRGRGSTRPPP